MAMAYTQAITLGPDGQMYTDGSMQTPYNPPQNQPYQQDIARPININTNPIRPGGNIRWRP
jgi:hypothetical protein